MHLPGGRGWSPHFGMLGHVWVLCRAIKVRLISFMSKKRKLAKAAAFLSPQVVTALL